MADSVLVDSVYIYIPNKGAPIAFAVAFFIEGLVLAWQTKYASLQTAILIKDGKLTN